MNHSKNLVENRSDSDDDEDEELLKKNNGAWHLLEMKNKWESNNLPFVVVNSNNVLSQPHTNNSDLDAKADTSITKYFEPKFVEVFENYCAGKFVDVSKHVMALCLEHLIPFSQWAREDTKRCNWIKQVLDDNPDLRPEVRNGLAMILMYSLSAVKAVQSKDSDMFTILQDPDNGLGIVNKTSLKIYNDPYNYFCFLKCCLSGLIDAGRIPENERQNQPKKPKKQAENRDELFSYLQMKNILITMLNSRENATVRYRVQKILNIWQSRQKIIRHRRFVIALTALSSPAIPCSAPSSTDGNQVPMATSYGNEMEIPKGKLLVDPTHTHSKSNAFNESEPNGKEVNNSDINNLADNATLGLRTLVKATSQVFEVDSVMNNSGTNSNPTARVASGNVGVLGARRLHSLAFADGVNPSHSNSAITPNSLRTQSNLFSSTKNGPINHPPSNGEYSVTEAIEETDHRPTKKSTSISINPAIHPNQASTTSHPFSQSQRTAYPPVNPLNLSNSIAPKMIQVAPQNGNNSDSVIYPIGNLRSSLLRGFGNLIGRHPPISMMKLERSAARVWEMKESKMYNLGAILLNLHVNIYLIDETKLLESELQQRRLTNTDEILNISIESIFHDRGALITSWSPLDYIQLLEFVLSWSTATLETNCSLAKCWYVDSIEMKMIQTGGGGRTIHTEESSPSDTTRRDSFHSHHDPNESNAEPTSTTTNHQQHPFINKTTPSLPPPAEGILVYEVLKQIGIVVRKNEELAITDDCWRLMYPHELKAAMTASNFIFTAFLSTIFPQLRNLFGSHPINSMVKDTEPCGSSSSSSNIVVKYFSHPFDQSSSHHVPPSLPLSSYQTIGTADEKAADIIARFDSNLSFHDVILFRV